MTAFALSRSQADQLPADAVGRFRRLLVDELEANIAQAAAHDSAARELAGQTDADSVIERELALGGAARARVAIEDLQAALAKVGLGTYGVCEACGRPMALERLEAIPQARLCVSCSRPAAGGLPEPRR